jgi:hypothetical protein
MERAEISVKNQRGQFFLVWILPMLLVVLVWLLLSPLHLGFPPVIRAILIAPVLFLLPGYLLQRALFPGKEWGGLNLLPIAFGLSLGVGALAWLLARALGAGLNVFGYLVGGTVTMLAALVILWRRPKVQRAPIIVDTRSSRDLLPLLLVLATVLFWSMVVFRIGANYMPRTDNWYYLAIVRRIMVAGNLVPGDPSFAGVADAERSGPWLAMVALWAKQGGIDLAALWNLLPALVMSVSLLAFYWLAWTLFRDCWVASLAVALILAGRAGFTWNAPMMMAVPSNVALLLSFVGLGLAIEYGRTGRAVYLVTAVLLAGATAAQHVLVFGGMLLMLVAFGLAQLGMGFLTSRLSEKQSDMVSPTEWRRAGGRLALVVVLGILVATPALLFWGRSTAGTTNPIYDDLWGLFKEMGPWHVLRVSSLSGGPHLFAFSFLLLPLLVLHVRRHDWAVFLLAMMTLVVLIAFTPPVVEWILRTHLLPPWGIWRLAAQVYPFQLMIAALTCRGARQLWPSVLALFGGRRWLSILIIGGLVLLGWVPNATPVVNPLLNYVQMARRGCPMEDVVTWLREGPLAALPRTEEPVVVLSDVNTSFYISGLTGHYVVAIPYGHASPLVLDDQQRRDEVSDVLTADTNIDQMRALLERYDVTALVLVAGPDLGEAALSLEAWQYWVDTLEAAGNEFKCLFRDETGDRRAAVYLWRSGGGAP